MGAAERALRLLLFLAGRRWGVGYQQLVDEYGVCDRTIRRDLNLLRDLGFKVDDDILDDGTTVFYLTEIPSELEGFIQRHMAHPSQPSSPPPAGGSNHSLAA